MKLQRPGRHECWRECAELDALAKPHRNSGIREVFELGVRELEERERHAGRPDVKPTRLHVRLSAGSAPARRWTKVIDRPDLKTPAKTLAFRYLSGRVECSDAQGIFGIGSFSEEDASDHFPGLGERAIGNLDLPISATHES